MVERRDRMSQASGLVGGRWSGTTPAGIRRRLRALLWASVPVWSLGVLSFVPFFRRAIGTRRARDWGVVLVYFAVTIVEMVLVAVAGDPSKPGGSNHALGDISGGLVLLLMGVGGVHAWVAYRGPAEFAAVEYASPRDANRSIVAAATEAAKRRVEGRRIVQENPVLARDLRIGRPDLPRAFDDGGLIDVNHASTALLVQALGWTSDEAAKVIEARERAGGFQSAAELTAYAEIDPRRVDGVADLLVFCRL